MSPLIDQGVVLPTVNSKDGGGVGGAVGDVSTIAAIRCCAARRTAAAAAAAEQFVEVREKRHARHKRTLSSVPSQCLYSVDNDTTGGKSKLHRKSGKRPCKYQQKPERNSPTFAMPHSRSPNDKTLF